MKGQRADAVWESEFGLGGLISYWEIGTEDAFPAGVRAGWEVEGVREGELG